LVGCLVGCGFGKRTDRSFELEQSPQWPDPSNRLAIVIGIDDYQDPGIQPLKGAVKDARRLADALANYAGFDREHIVLMTSDQKGDNEPSYGTILRRLSNLGHYARQTKDALLFFSFAGHGVDRGGRAFLLPADVQMNGDSRLLQRTAISVDEITDWIQDSGAHQAFFIVDACRANVERGRSAGAALSRVVVDKFNYAVRNAGIEAFVTIYATSAGGRAYETKNGEGGIFTTALVEALSGQAAGPQGDVTLQDLIKYLEDNVPKRVAWVWGQEQRPWPVMQGYGAGKLVIAHRSPPATTVQDAVATLHTTIPSGPGIPPKARPTEGVSLPPSWPVSSETGAALALELIESVDQSPKDQDAPTNLHNACAIYETVYRFGEATKCYERLAHDYPQSSLAKDAVWSAARNHRRFFNFDKAVALYQQIATDPAYTNYEHRKDALGLAAQLLDNDQQYARAADFYKRYADAVQDNPLEAAEAHYRACQAYEKWRNTTRTSQCLQDLIKRCGSNTEAGKFVVKSYLKLATIAEQSGQKKETLEAYRRVRDEFVARRLPPASEEAAAAAKGEFLLVEEKFAAFKARPLKFTADQKQVKRTFDTFTADCKALADDYRRVWNYRDSTWTLASFLRMGDVYYEFAQKMIKAGDDPPADVKAADKKLCHLSPADCRELLHQYKDAILGFVTPIEDEAKKQWKATLERAWQLGVTNEYVKKARENLSKYLPDEFPFMKDERIAFVAPE
jgi:hypothetical protein